MQTSETEVTTTIPTMFTHSVKIEQSAKGARVTVHVNANDALEAMNQSINPSTFIGLPNFNSSNKRKQSHP